MNFDLKKLIITVCGALVLWDVMTTYFGTVQIFNVALGNTDGTFFSRLGSTPIFAHIVALFFAIGLVVVIISYKAIWNSENDVTRPLLIVGFIYDFSTSFYGTFSALDLPSKSFAAMAILLLFAIATSAAPMLISQVLDDG